MALPFRRLVSALLAMLLTSPAVARAEEPSAASSAAPHSVSTASEETRGATEAPPAGTGDPYASESERAPTAPKRKRMGHDRPGGINPCMTPDPGFGLYDGWSRNISMGQLLAPKRGGLTKSGAFDLLVHFHGHEPLRKEFVKSANGIVLVAIDLGIGSGAYSSAFATPQVFEKLLDSVRQEMARRTGRPDTQIRRLGLSSWSAGYGAIQQILRQPAGAKVDAVVLLDSLHAGYQPGTNDVAPTGLDPFVSFATKAARGQKFLYQSYSSIIPPGYASTREVAHFLVNQMGGQVKRTKRADVLGLSMDERFDRGHYHVRGYLGDDKPDHCAHLGLIKDVVKAHLNRRWSPPRAIPDRRRPAAPPLKSDRNRKATGAPADRVSKRRATPSRR